MDAQSHVCRDPKGCAARAARRHREYERVVAIGETELEWYRAVPDTERFFVLDVAAHSSERQLRRAVSDRFLREVPEVGEVIWRRLEENGHVRLLLLASDKVGPGKYRPIHVMVEFDPNYPDAMWPVTVYDPTTRPWKWANGWREQVCWCEPERLED